MRKHRFEPASLVTGLVFLGLAAAFLLDAAGEWDIPPRWGAPLAGGGLALAALTAAVTGVLRGLRTRSAGRPGDRR